MGEKTNKYFCKSYQSRNMDDVDFDDWISRVDSCNECDVKVVNEAFWLEH